MTTEKPKSTYPQWACWECGVKHGSKKQRINFWHYGRCDVCSKNKDVVKSIMFGDFKRWVK